MSKNLSELDDEIEENEIAAYYLEICRYDKDRSISNKTETKKTQLDKNGDQGRWKTHFDIIYIPIKRRRKWPKLYQGKILKKYMQGGLMPFHIKFYPENQPFE